MKFYLIDDIPNPELHSIYHDYDHVKELYSLWFSFYVVGNEVINECQYEERSVKPKHNSHIFIDPHTNRVHVKIYDRNSTSKRPRSNSFDFDLYNFNEPLHGALKRGFTNDETQQVVILVEALIGSMMKHRYLNYRP